MSIKPENASRYPGGGITSAEWRAIRQEVLEREGRRCKKCGAPDGETILRITGDGIDHYILASTREIFDADTGEFIRLFPADKDLVGIPRRVVLTIAHLDHDPANNGAPRDRPNLAALCQRHHLAHDREHHAEQRRITLERKRIEQFGPMLPF